MCASVSRDLRARSLSLKDATNAFAAVAAAAAACPAASAASTARAAKVFKHDALSPHESSAKAMSMYGHERVR